MDWYILLVGSACVFVVGIIIFFGNRIAWYMGYRAGVRDRNELYHKGFQDGLNKDAKEAHSEGFKQGVQVGVKTEKIIMKKMERKQR